MSVKSFFSNITNAFFTKQIDFGLESKREKIVNYIDPNYNREINQGWVKEDVSFLIEFEDILQETPVDILTFFKKYKKGKQIDLGFGYKLIVHRKSGGYAAILSELIFKNDELIAYKIYPDFPDSKKLMNQYIDLFKGSFKIENDYAYYIFYELEKTEKAIDLILKNAILSENLKFLMTPYSGTIYGGMNSVGPVYSNNGPLYGEKDGKLINRVLFEQEKKNITPKICFTLMHSLNPATRLMAIEFYLNNSSAFDNVKEVENRMNEIYEDSPTIATIELRGTTYYTETVNSKELVQKLAKELK